MYISHTKSHSNSLICDRRWSPYNHVFDCWELVCDSTLAVLKLHKLAVTFCIPTVQLFFQLVKTTLPLRTMKKSSIQEAVQKKPTAEVVQLHLLPRVLQVLKSNVSCLWLSRVLLWCRLPRNYLPKCPKLKCLRNCWSIGFWHYFKFNHRKRHIFGQ